MPDAGAVRTDANRFFKPGTKGYHVGIYLNHGEFVHTSNRCGVMISRMDDDPYPTRRRLP